MDVYTSQHDIKNNYELYKQLSDIYIYIINHHRLSYEIYVRLTIYMYYIYVCIQLLFLIDDVYIHINTYDSPEEPPLGIGFRGAYSDRSVFFREHSIRRTMIPGLLHMRRCHPHLVFYYQELVHVYVHVCMYFLHYVWNTCVCFGWVHVYVHLCTYRDSVPTW